MKVDPPTGVDVLVGTFSRRADRAARESSRDFDVAAGRDLNHAACATLRPGPRGFDVGKAHLVVGVNIHRAALPSGGFDHAVEEHVATRPACVQREVASVTIGASAQLEARLLRPGGSKLDVADVRVHFELHTRVCRRRGPDDGSGLQYDRVGRERQRTARPRDRKHHVLLDDQVDGAEVEVASAVDRRVLGDDARISDAKVRRLRRAGRVGRQEKNDREDASSHSEMRPLDHVVHSPASLDEAS